MTTPARDAVFPGRSGADDVRCDLISQVPDGVPATLMSYQEAIREALREEMLRDASRLPDG